MMSSWFFPDISDHESGAKVGEILKKSHGVIGLRVGFGNDKDDHFEGWRKQCAKAKVVLIYHFPVKSGAAKFGSRYGGSVQENAERFVKMVGKLRPNEVPVLDVEGLEGGNRWSLNDCKKWMSIVSKALGGPTPMIYANESYITENGLSPLFTGYKGWVAKYAQAGRFPHEPKYRYLAWQCSADTYVIPNKPRWPGTSVACDTNIVRVSPEEFYKRALSFVKGRGPVYEYGDTGPAVGALQELLNKALKKAGSKTVLEKDGAFGQKTESAVTWLQKFMKIEADGAVGDDTRAAIKKLLAA